MKNIFKEIVESSKIVIMFGENEEDIFNYQKEMIKEVEYNVSVKAVYGEERFKELLAEYPQFNIIECRERKYMKKEERWDLHIRRSRHLVVIDNYDNAEVINLAYNENLLNCSTILLGSYSKCVDSALAELYQAFTTVSGLDSINSRDLLFESIGYAIDVNHNEVIKVTWQPKTEDFSYEKIAHSN